MLPLFAFLRAHFTIIQIVSQIILVAIIVYYTESLFPLFFLALIIIGLLDQSASLPSGGGNSPDFDQPYHDELRDNPEARAYWKEYPFAVPGSPKPNTPYNPKPERPSKERTPHKIRPDYENLERISPLKASGYTVGSLGKNKELRRRQILKAIEISIQSPYSKTYRKRWGDPKSKKRIIQIIAHIEWLVAIHSGNERLHLSRIHWQEDVKWMKSTYARKF